jgi:hypothetical protein
LDMCLHLEHPTVCKIWVYLCDLFTGKKSSHAIHLERKLHNLVQGELSANDFCHRLQQLVNSLVDCDIPVGDRTLVHQLIHGLNPKFSVLKTLLPLLPKSPTFVEAHELVLSDEASRAADSMCIVETALLATSGSTPKQDPAPPAPPATDRTSSNNGNTNYYNNSNNGGGWGHGRGRGGRNGGHDGGGRNNFNDNLNNAHGWGQQWGGNWRAPWTSATCLGLLGTRPPAVPSHAFQAYQPATMQAPLQAPSWDPSGLVQALHVASLQQSYNQGDRYMDSGTSSHMTGDQGTLTKYLPSLLHDYSQVVVGNGSRLPILGIGSTHLRAPNINFLLASVLHTHALVSNLVSLRKFTRDSLCSIEFDMFDFSIKDLLTRTTILRSNS